MSAAPDNMVLTKTFPKLGTGSVGIERYTSEEYFTREKEKIFRKSWLNVANVEDLPTPGDLFTLVLPTFDIPVLLTHGMDGEIRAFYNVCSHRQFPVVLGKKRHCKGKFACGMHGWVYSTEGKLVKIIDEHGYSGVDRKKNDLTPISCGVWNGFIFINLDSAPKVSLGEHMAPLNKFFDDYPIAQMRADYNYSAYENANWKQMIHGQSESHHIPYLHKSTIAAELGMSSAPRVIPTPIFRTFDSHRALGAPIDENSTFSEPKDAAKIGTKFGVKSIYSPSAEALESGRQQYAWNKEFGVVASFNVFPNMQFILSQEKMIVTRFTPISASRSIFEIAGYGIPPTTPLTPAQLFAKHYADVTMRETFREDGGACELVQRGLLSGAKTHSHYHDSEIALRHLDHAVEECLAE